MKRVLCSIIVVLAIVAFANVSNAAPAAKLVNAQVSCDSNGNVTIGAMPDIAKLVDVEIYDDVNGTKPKRIGAVNSFKLEHGQGFNFLWSDSSGVHYQMITPQTAPPTGLEIDKSWVDPKTGQPACKYLYK
jgi:hypothetical protein